MKNKKLIRLIAIEFCLLGLVFLFSFFLRQYQMKIYKEELRKNNEILVGNILTKYPFLEEEIMQSILFSIGDEQLGQEIFAKYKLDDDTIFSLVNNEQTVAKKVYYPILVFILVLFFSLFLINLFYILTIYRKIRFIDTYMNRVLKGENSLLIKDNEEGDIGNLKSDIYKMTVKLKEQSEISIQDKKNLESVLSDISHQLKTPLTSMYMINDLLSEDLTPTMKKEFLNKNRNQLTRIEWLVTSLLKISRLDSGTIQLKKEKISVSDLVEKSLEPLCIPIELKNITLQVDIPKTISIVCDENWTREAIINIVKNASEHTPSKGKIMVSASSNPIYTEIQIQDTGSGITPKDAPHIFERFYKGSDNKESIGIGLNMAKTIIEKQNASISFTTQLQKGTTFSIKFYK